MTSRSSTAAAAPDTRSRGEKARREITASAVRFLWDRGVRDLTVARLMEGTALSRSAFYQYFTDMHGLIESLLGEIERVMHEAANPWIHGEGEPVAALRESLMGIVRICVEHGPVLRAITEAAPFDARLECAWNTFIERWDAAVAARIAAQQDVGLVAAHDPLALAQALNRLDVIVLVAEFGRRPQGDPDAVLHTLHRIWVGALYGHH